MAKLAGFQPVPSLARPLPSCGLLLHGRSEPALTCIWGGGKAPCIRWVGYLLLGVHTNTTQYHWIVCALPCSRSSPRGERLGHLVARIARYVPTSPHLQSSSRRKRYANVSRDPSSCMLRDNAYLTCLLARLRLQIFFSFFRCSFPFVNQIQSGREGSPTCSLDLKDLAETCAITQASSWSQPGRPMCKRQARVLAVTLAQYSPVQLGHYRLRTPFNKVKKSECFSKPSWPAQCANGSSCVN